jgi:hypothetical protein
MIARRSHAAAHRVFLDANILFSAAYRTDSALGRLWRLGAPTELVTSLYAIDEARRNLGDVHARERLTALVAALRIVPDILDGRIPAGVELPAHDRPILLSAIAAHATHLLTGDRAHFGIYFERNIGGVLIQRPSAYLYGLPEGHRP